MWDSEKIAQISLFYSEVDTETPIFDLYAINLTFAFK